VQVVHVVQIDSELLIVKVFFYFVCVVFTNG